MLKIILYLYSKRLLTSLFVVHGVLNHSFILNVVIIQTYHKNNGNRLNTYTTSDQQDAGLTSF